MMKAQIIAAAGLLFSSRAYAQQSLNQGSGFGTYYFDVEQIETCGTSFAAQNQGGVMCSHIASLPLTDINTNYVVAMNNTLLRGDMAKYCGKKVVVSVNGVASSLPLFIGDGCERCGTGPSTSDTWEANGAPGLDFSYSVLNELSGSACADGHIDITWEIVDEKLYNFDTDGSGTVQGPASGGSSSGSSSSAAAKVATTATTSTSSSATQESTSTSQESTSASQESTSATQESTSASQESTSASQESTSASQESASSASTSVSSASQAVNSPADVAQAAVPTTMITQTAKAASTTSDAPTTSYTPTATSGLEMLATPTTSEPSAPCATGVWECNGDSLMQCLDGKWVTRATCVDGLSCQGGNSPYCAPAGFSKALGGN
ncbi:hypothetical protein VC83_08331 [Pseudogymnoascus destructans]|uniref:Uncharacterized protein n=2 Tax=Pseudogymnoascus destructans TaxID=655981 RepID=L8GBV3_PSED2|nr:uncharacterized protein VC83_08331 [Pseudogymnoascus destructans]ELR10690.1 hypothetical protein GMDG_04951 [Pseudogymnoascus destructans 20631-21]OAF55405.1 hypothetical protein VC83_08331 [Pseudogymnoascus destructans]